MALIKFGGGVAGISGAIGGTVFARNKAGAYARNWAKPTNAPTPSQTERRVAFGNVSAGWGGLTGSDRDSWNAAASLIKRLNRFGEEYVPSGRQYYMELNTSLTTAGMTGIATPPVADTPPTLPMLALEFTSTTGAIGTLRLTGGSTVADVSYVVEATPVLPGNQKSNFTNQFRQVGIFASGSPVDIEAAYTAIFGTAAETGDQIACRVTAIGELTGLRSAQLIVTQYAS